MRKNKALKALAKSHIIGMIAFLIYMGAFVFAIVKKDNFYLWAGLVALAILTLLSFAYRIKFIRRML